MSKAWIQQIVGGSEFELLNLQHPEVEARVIDDMSQGVKVYYDRRWEITEVLTDWLGQNQNAMRKKKALVLGAGIGAESLILGHFAEHVWLNDLSKVALELSARQMEQNGLHNFTLLEGRYEELVLPQVDLVVASFLVYNDETRKAMEAFLEGHQGELVLVNESLPDFKKLMKGRDFEPIFENDSGMMGVRLR